MRALTLRELLTGTYVFELPWFQRAYAWQTENVTRLMNDLFDALKDNGEVAEYFLGTVLICKSEGSPSTALIDGHQRLMTLTILFSVLRDLSTNESDRDNIGQFVRSEDVHLKPQDMQAKFCLDYVQSDGATSAQPDELFENLSFTERNIIASRDYIRECLSSEDKTPQDRMALFDFLADRCHVIVHYAPDENEAWARLRKEEETRLDFSSVDLAKDNILSLVPAEERGRCAQIWEEAENLIGGDDLFGLLRCLRDRKVGKSRKPLEEEIAEAFKLNTNAVPFLQNTLLPEAHRIRMIRRGEIGPRDDQARIAKLCQYMCWIDQRTWLAPALAWIKQYGIEHHQTLDFFVALERLFWLLNMTPDCAEKLAPRMMKLVKSIEKGVALDKLVELQIERKLKKNALEKLRAQYFDRRALRAEVMRRIAAADGEDPGPSDRDNVTVEHILPRGWKVQNTWRVAFPDRDHVVTNAHKLGNLTYLTREENLRADSEEFEKKKEIYARTRFKMTRELANYTSWQQDDIDARTEKLIATLFADWELEL